MKGLHFKSLSFANLIQIYLEKNIFIFSDIFPIIFRINNTFIYKPYCFFMPRNHIVW